VSDDNVVKIDRRLTEKHLFQPGQSGNPAGVSSAVLRLRAKVRRYAVGKSMRAMYKLVELLESEDERVVYMAATAILDRAGIRAADTAKAGETDRSSLGYVLVPVKDPVATDAPTNTLPVRTGG
jgi:hypothetical protein